jgi:hypothetical protein
MAAITAGVDADLAVAYVFRKQFGVVSLGQALACGYSSFAVRRRVSTGRWTRLHAGNLASREWPRTWLQTVMAACLWAGKGTAASHRTAAALLGLDGFDEGPIEISGPRRLESETVRCHRVQALFPGEVVLIRRHTCYGCNAHAA